MNKVSSSLLLIMCCVSMINAQQCSDALLLKRNSNSLQVSDSTVSWFKFKAKGGQLKLTMNWVESDSAVNYTLYNESYCLTNEKDGEWPVRMMSNGLSVLTEELWDYTIKHGNCVCKHCLSKVKIERSNPLKMKQEAFYYLKVEGNLGKLSIQFEWGEIDSSKRVFSLQSGAEAMELGMIYQLKTIQFIPSKAVFINKNTPLELDSLYDFLMKNPKVKIDVVGHVNGPFNHDLEGYQKLSVARAKKIKDYLVQKGLSEERVSYKGKGNTQMKYASPKEEWQAQQNRRVEIVITDL